MRPPTRSMRILAAAGVLALALIGLVLREGAARAGGKEVLVEITGYDPRALLTGHYVEFQMRQERPPGTPCPPGAGRDVLPPVGWVALSRQGERHVASGMASTRGAAERLGSVVARGAVLCQSLSGFHPDGPRDGGVALTLFVGVDRLHADQTRAEALQKQLQSPATLRQPAYAVLSIGSDGKARLKGLVVAGRRTDLGWL